MNENDASFYTEHFEKPIINKKKGFSPIWILPIVALLLGVGLILKSYLDAGIMITLQAPTAEGIEVGKTKVLYKGITTGVVKDRTVTDDLQSVILHIEMDKRTEPFLNTNSKFWIVEPRISLSGISGLDTLIGGRYIGMDTIDKGEPKRDFVALDVPPPPSSDTPGLHIKLRLNRLASVDRGTIIYYKQIPVGEVTNYTLAEHDTEIHAWVLIKPEYAHLVKTNSHFYNVSGIKIDASLSGIKVKTESLISMLASGISFYTPNSTETQKPAKHGDFYFLYDDFESAQVGIPIVLRFKNTESLRENDTEIKFQGRKIGRLGSFTYDKEKNEIISLAMVDPLLENALKENTQFWIVKPSVDLLKISGLDALLSGNYIQMRPTIKGSAKREFLVFGSKPALSESAPGLHIYMEADVLGSISKKSPIYYKNIQVGRIEGFRLTKDAKKVHLKAFIEPEYSHLVKKNTRFYNVSGLNIKGGLSGIHVKIESLVSLLKGGVAFYTPEHEANVEESENAQVFTLYKNFDDAKAGLEVSLTFDSAIGLSESNTKIIYQGIVLGVIKKIVPDKSHGTVKATAILDPIAKTALVEDTQFWLVKPKISVTEIKNIETLFSGEYITLRLGDSQKKSTVFKVAQTQPPLNSDAPGLHLKLKSTELGSISIGSPVMYNRIKIGDVQDYELAENREAINILIHIWPQYIDMVTQHSRFYNATGIHIDASLAGIEIHTGSIESIMKGGIALYNEPIDKTKHDKKKYKKIANGRIFNLFNDLNAAKMNAFYVTVQFSDIKGLVVGSAVQYKGVKVGEVQTINLSHELPDSIQVLLELDSSLKDILGKHSRFWITTAQLGLTRTENLDTLIKGSYISIDVVKGKLAHTFIGLEDKPLIDHSLHGFTVHLNASRLSSVKVGDPVYYRQVKVGTVVGYELADTADQILIHLSIRNRFRALIRENTQFWHASGVSVDLNLFGKSTIRTESMEAILSGGIAFATPDNERMGKQLKAGSFFVLHDEPQEQWLHWNPIIQLEQETQQD